MTNEPKHIGLVGLGPHGTNHTDMLQSMGHRISGADADTEYRERFEQRFGGPTYTAPDELYERDLDAVIVSTPNKFHEAVAVDALRAGFDVLVEKPLAHNADSAERIASAARETDNVCTTGYSNRFVNGFRVLRNYAKAGYFGEIVHVNASHVRRRGVPGRGSWYTSADIAGGGALMDIGASLFSLLLPLVEWAPLEKVDAITRSEFGDRDDYSYLQMWGQDTDGGVYDVEDSVEAFCRFDGGISASVEVAWAANAESRHVYELQGTDAGGRLTMPNRYEDSQNGESGVELELFETRSRVIDHFVDSTITVPANDPYRDELGAFLSAVERGKRPGVNDIEEAIQVQHVLDRVHEASSRSA